jgi:serine/threonine protein kinase
MAMGSTPFPGKTAAAILENLLTQEPIVPLHFDPGLPAEFQAIINKALQKDPSLRYQHAAEMHSDLQHLKQASDPQMQLSVVARPPASGATGRLWRISIVAIVLALALIAAYFSSRRPPKLTDKDTIVLADFTNTTGDQVFDDTLKQGLSVQLEK